jgi:geranylgeranyl diphosphate synthase type II
LGVAFQILNDLADWQQDSHNKLSSGGDVLGGRPTVLWALALELLGEEDRRELESLVSAQPATADTVERVRRLYEKARVFEKASRLVEKYQQRAEAVADQLQPDELRRLFHYLIDTVLDRPTAAEPTTLITPGLPGGLPVVAVS